MKKKSSKLSRAMARMVLDHPFFATILFRMPLREDADIRTASTDGRQIRYNARFINALSVEQVQFVLAHLVMHVAHFHPLRRGGRDPARFNKAGDYVINGILKEAGFRLLPGALHSNEYRNLAVEQIYERLPATPDEEENRSASGTGNEPDDDPGGCGAFEDARDKYNNPMSRAQRHQLEAEITIALQQASQAAKMQGKLSSCLARLADRLVHPVLDWREILCTFIDRTARSDYSWVQPNRRHIASGIYLPSLRSHALKPLVLAVDTSGSIRQKQLNQFQAELNDILCSYPSTVTVVYCDSEISGSQVFTPEQYPVELKAQGWGGTDLRPPFAWARKNVPEAGCLIYLTDLLGDSPDVDPGVPTLWVSTTPDRDIPERYRPRFGHIATLD